MNGLCNVARWMLTLSAGLAGFSAQPVQAQVPVAVTTWQPAVPAAPVVTYVPERRGLFGLQTVWRPVVAYAAPVATVAPLTTYYAPAPAVTTYRIAPAVVMPAAPVVTGYAPAPMVTGYAPAPMVTGYAPAPVVTGYAPAPVVTGYAPAPVVTGYAPAPVVRSYSPVILP